MEAVKAKVRAEMPPARISYGIWSATSELKWKEGVLMQKFRRRVKRQWSGQDLDPPERWSTTSRSMEYEWKPIPVEA